MVEQDGAVALFILFDKKREVFLDILFKIKVLGSFIS